MLVAAAAIPAAAQDLNLTTTAPVTAVSTTHLSFMTGETASAFPMPADVSFLADAQTQRPGVGSATPMHQMGDKQVMIMLQGGIQSCCGSTGFLVGVGASIKPMKDNNKVEIAADVNYGRSGGANDLYISFNGLYDFHMQDSTAVPFAGAGIGIYHASANGFGATETDLQILGGVDFKTAGNRDIRAQLRFVFTTETTTVLMVGYAF